MSATIDVNVLLYASDESSAFYVKAKELIARLARGADLIYLFWPVLMGYLRLSTHPAVFRRPLSVDAAMNNVEQLLALPQARSAGEGARFWSVYQATTAGLVVRGNLVPDAHLASLMRENGVGTLWSHDRDFRRFVGIRVQDPFA